jgi:FkbM family methyltransferase
MAFLHISEHSLLAAPLRAGITVLDLGANRGHFSEQLSARYPGSYHAVEANPALAAELSKNRLFETVSNRAVTDTSAPVVLRLGQNDVTSSVLRLPTESPYGALEVGTVQVEGVALKEFVAGRDIHVLKLDIEGAEIAALASLTHADLQRIVQITVEFHGDRVFGFGLADATEAAIEALRSHGFTALDFAPGHRDTLFINTRLHQASAATVARWRVEAAAARWWIAAGPLRVIVGRWRRRLLNQTR